MPTLPSGIKKGSGNRGRAHGNNPKQVTLPPGLGPKSKLHKNKKAHAQPDLHGFGPKRPAKPAYTRSPIAGIKQGSGRRASGSGSGGATGDTLHVRPPGGFTRPPTKGGGGSGAGATGPSFTRPTVGTIKKGAGGSRPMPAGGYTSGMASMAGRKRGAGTPAASPANLYKRPPTKGR